MPKLSLPLTELIHENLSIVMTYSYSARPLHVLLDTQFAGSWPYLRKSLFEFSHQRAIKACIELATYLRLLDDREGLSSYLRETRGFGFGRVYKPDTSEENLYLRDLTNKVIHAS